MVIQAMAETFLTPWVEPTQARSREKVTRILDAAVALAVASKSLDLNVTEVARRADVAIGTFYQYFPNRSALIAKLFQREMEPIDASIAASLEDFGSIEDLSAAIERQMQAHLKLVKKRPGLLIIWSAGSADPDIQAADYRNTRQNARSLAEALYAKYAIEIPDEDIEATCLLICHLWGAVIRLCVMSDAATARTILRQYAGMIAEHSRKIFERIL